MPDCRIEERFNTAPQESLHIFLKQYMELEDRYIKEFCDEKHTSKFNDKASENATRKKGNANE